MRIDVEYLVLPSFSSTHPAIMYGRSRFVIDGTEKKLGKKKLGTIGTPFSWRASRGGRRLDAASWPIVFPRIVSWPPSRLLFLLLFLLLLFFFGFVVDLLFERRPLAADEAAITRDRRSD